MIAEKRVTQNPLNMSNKELLSNLSRYDSKRKVNSIHIKLQRAGLEKLLKYKTYLKMISIKLKSYKTNQ